jgi:hypothetical protein
MESVSFGINSEEINISHEVFSSIIQAAFRRGFESSEYVPSFGQEALLKITSKAEREEILKFLLINNKVGGGFLAIPITDKGVYVCLVQGLA